VGKKTPRQDFTDEPRKILESLLILTMWQQQLIRAAIKGLPATARGKAARPRHRISRKRRLAAANQARGGASRHGV